MTAISEATKKIFMDEVGFLKWVQVAQDDVDGLHLGQGFGRVFISPDVHSLHIIWEEPGQPSGEVLWHEIEDYDEGCFADSRSPSEFLSNHIGDDCQGPIEWTDDPFEAMSDFGTVSPDNCPVVTFEQLDKFQRVF